MALQSMAWNSCKVRNVANQPWRQSNRSHYGVLTPTLYEHLGNHGCPPNLSGNVSR